MSCGGFAERTLEWELSRKADPREFDGLLPDPVVSIKRFMLERDRQRNITKADRLR